MAEREGIPRYTKTEKEGAAVNTSNLNWFCAGQ